jgi:PAS domain-containing protein
MVIANTNAKLIWVNDKWHEITGIAKGESLDSWIDRVAPEYMSLLLQTVGDLMETRAVSNMDFMWNDGTWANFTTRCDYDEDGVFVGLIGTLSDATRRKRAELNEIDALVKREAEARRAAEEVEQRNRELAEANVMNQKLQQQRNMLASMAEISPTGLTISKADGTIVWANKAFLAMHGLDDSTKGEWADTVVEEDASRLVDMWAEWVASEVVISGIGPHG